MSTTYYYLRPTDSLFIRSNLAFGDSGEHGTSSMPPQPSLFAGAFRSALLGQNSAQLQAFVDHGQCSDPALAQCLGRPDAPGDFCLTWLSLAGELGQVDSSMAFDAIAPLPADVLLLNKTLYPLKPQPLAEGVQSSGELPLRATLQSAQQEKPQSGWLRHAQLAQHLRGEAIADGGSVSSKQLYQNDPRLGIGLDTHARTVQKGQIYTTDGFAFNPVQKLKTNDPSDLQPYVSTGFLIGIQGIAKLLPQQGVLRLGGDGRSAYYRQVGFTAPSGAIGQRGFRLILQTPGLFSQGWLPENVQRQGEHFYLKGDGFSARLACAALGRREIISGWDLFQWLPKPAQATAPAGSVYWFDEFAGDPQQLLAWIKQGLWPSELSANQKIRRAEGYNRALLGAWN